MYKEKIYIGLGSNLRSISFLNAEKLFQSVIVRLNITGIRVIKSSNNWLSSPIPFTSEPSYLNKVLKCIYIGRKRNTPLDLFNKLTEIETALGKRRKKKKLNARIIDIDFLDYNGIIYNNKIILPHPRLHIRKFVLNPLLSVNKNWKHPKLKLRIPQLVAKIREKQNLKEILS